MKAEKSSIPARLYRCITVDVYHPLTDISLTDDTIRVKSASLSCLGMLVLLIIWKRWKIYSQTTNSNAREIIPFYRFEPKKVRPN